MSSTENQASGRRGVRRLSGALIDQIAAGEVVERPASVVKELVENALDADASRVRVEVREGGRSWIAVADDGVGMTPADARLALERHATSKIADAEDLARIASFGFRGEALPAIASVSQLRLRTRARGEPEGHEIRVGVGRILEERAASGPEGTRVEVADLFQAVPARRKFLKTPATEWGHVADWLGRAALALPGVHFEVRRDERPALVWPATSDALDRVAAVLGEPTAAALVPVVREEGRAGVQGFVSRPDHHRPTTAGLHLFVNGRPVRDRMLQHALMDVYRDLLPRGRFPAAVLFLRVPPGAVDVNVHPAKWEVRFADPQQVHRMVRGAVRGAVEERRWLGHSPEAASPRGEAAQSPGAPGPGAGADWSPRERPAGTPVLRDGGGPGASDWLFADTTATAAAPAEERVRFGELRRLGQLLGTYLVLEGKAGLLLVDQHAAHERVLYERLRCEWVERGVESQVLLAPVTVSLEASGAAALEGAGDVLRRLGFDLEPFGGDTVAVRAVPALLADRDPAGLVRGLADEWRAAGSASEALADGTRALDAADRVFASLACHAARRKGEILDPREQDALLAALDTIPWAPTCPHGRPVAVPLPLGEIERRFGRR
jgi:DNA mismatch repair protein MutL